ncbi:MULTISPECIES: PoNe immunity protein domain-containing protein [Burkholderia]|uniref:PoNi C-terminal domain-containing protein n=1 Tax=Burkholderia paludis TaxID=1506587 RepID=A0A6P2L0D4_9BURK|nr:MULTISPECIES: PoNe immunity protein domain-containing protein [Burkholderia]CAB3752909.1 hypothetical protein LMG30113_01819 [Burkholderia paludis]VWB64321.1 hypothetical protein BPA30113_02866 [Burkholderia paludis]
MNFSKQKRQIYVTEKYYVELREVYLHEFERTFDGFSPSGNVNFTGYLDFLWSLASDGLELLVLDYTAGRSIEELRDQVADVIGRFDEFTRNRISLRGRMLPGNEVDTLKISRIDVYVYIFWLLALCKLLGRDEYIPKIMGSVDRTHESNRGRDGLLEAVVLQLTARNVHAPQVLLHPVPYRSLASATVRTPEERPALVKAFVENWYKGMKGTYWHGTHVDGRYFGYWCLEAALVTVLWDIDDSSYRDNPVYPKDLVNYARQSQAARRADEAALACCGR